MEKFSIPQQTVFFPCFTVSWLGWILKIENAEAYILELNRNVQNNKLSGSLPPSLANLKNLQTL
jgi:hypothetical protein